MASSLEEAERKCRQHDSAFNTVFPFFSLDLPRRTGAGTTVFSQLNNDVNRIHAVFINVSKRFDEAVYEVHNFPVNTEKVDENGSRIRLNLHN